jgi:hypothetical protein
MRKLVLIIAVALCATFLGCSKEVPMNEDLIGVWRTADKKYADRHFELTMERVIFSTGGWGVTAHPIDRMEQHSENDRTFYIIYYPTNEEGDESQFSFYYDPVQDVIRFKNQEQFEWVKWVEGPLYGQESEGDQPTSLETPETPLEFD